MSQNESLQYDVVIVGGGPAGLAAAIKLKQMAQNENRECHVCVLEKGAEIGAHILSGAIFEPQALQELFPDWQNMGAPLKTKVTKEAFFFFRKGSARKLPHFLLPPEMRNRGNYVISLGNLCRWLAQQAEAIGVEIYPGFSVAELLYDQQQNQDRVVGVRTQPMGRQKDGSQGPNYQPGITIYGNYVLLAEGARGSLSEQVIRKYDLRRKSCPQTYGLGLKELWEIPAEQHQPGKILHGFGWPLDRKTYGGGFLYHMDKNLVSVGFVVGLDYQNPSLSPFAEFQRFKTAPVIANSLKNGRRLSYGARCLTEGGWQSLPQLIFPGGALLGCSAGMVNVPKIKGSHNAIRSGILAAQACFAALAETDTPALLYAYQKHFKKSPIARELRRVRNCRPAFRFGLHLGVFLSGIELWLRGMTPWTLRHGKPDHQKLRTLNKAAKLHYDKADNTLTFDRLSSVFLTNTYHEENEPSHLHLKNPDIPIGHNLPKYGEPAQYYCPAGVYEITQTDQGPQFVINSQNCIHCKCCDIKDPEQNIVWHVPQGGGGPNYSNM